MATLTQTECTKLEHTEAVTAAARCAELLMSRFGATRVILFGSVLAPTGWHEDSDLDLAVEGIDPEQFFAAWRALRQVLPSDLQVDLVALEDANPRLRARILGEVVMAEDPIVRLRGLIDDELHALQQIVDLIAEAQTELDNPPTQFQLNGLASYIHQFYTGCERILERIATQVDQQLPQGAYSHANLLAQMAQPVSGLRPAVIDTELWVQLQDFLDFRHFFRHAYGFTLEWMRLKRLVDTVPQVLETLRQQLYQFFDHLTTKGEA